MDEELIASREEPLKTDAVAEPPPQAEGLPSKPRFIVLDTNLILRLLILECGVREKIDLFSIIGKACVSLVMAPCQEDEFWRNAPKVWEDHMDKWSSIAKGIRTDIDQLINGCTAMAKLTALTIEQEQAFAQIGSVKNVVSRIPFAPRKWEEFEAHAEQAFALYRASTRSDLFVTADVEAAAERRIRAGNPPCNKDKSRHWGDCVIWEAILCLARRNEGEVWFATTDGDFCSPSDDNELHPFLRREACRDGGVVRLFRENPNIGMQLRTEYALLQQFLTFVPEPMAHRMRAFLADLSAVSPDISWRDVELTLGELSYREREIVKLRLGLGDGYWYTQEEVGHIFQLSQPRISQIEKPALAMFFERLRLASESPKGNARDAAQGQVRNSQAKVDPSI